LQYVRNAIDPKVITIFVPLNNSNSLFRNFEQLVSSEGRGLFDGGAHLIQEVMKTLLRFNPSFEEVLVGIFEKPVS
jgi:hypothetical protein